jgi:hypothetical protein
MTITVKNVLFCAQKKTFYGFDNPFETIIGKKKANNSKTYFYRHKKVFIKAGSGKIRPILRPSSVFLKTGHSKPIQPIWSKICHIISLLWLQMTIS